MVTIRREESIKIKLSGKDPRNFRVPVVSVEKAEGETARIYSESMERQGYVGTPPLLLSTRPELRFVLGSFYAKEIEGKRRLPMEVWQYIMIVVAGANQCQYCASSHSHHTEIFSGVESRKLAKIYKGDWEGAGIDLRLRALLEYAKKLTLRPYAITDGDIESLRAAGYDDGEILEATVVICQCNAVNRLVNALSGTPIPELAVRYLS